MNDHHERQNLPLWPWLLLIAAVAVAFWLILSRNVTMDDVRSVAGDGHVLIAEHPLLGALAVWGAVFACGVLSIPLKGVINVLAGALLGPVLATLVVISGVLAGASLLFAAARRWLRGRFEQRMGSLARKVEARLSRRPIRAVAGLRLMITLPYGPISIACALTSIRYRDFVLGSALGDLPVIALYAVAGERLATLASPGEAISPAAAAVLIGAGLLLVIGSLAGGREKKRLGIKAS
ncbi:MAG: VTT domain-containing protein [Polyangia bacterium]